MRNKLVQRRVKQTNSHRTTLHSLEDTLEVSLLIWQNLSQCLATSFRIFRQNHFTHGFDFLTLKEHVFRTAKTDSYRTEITCHLSIMRSIRIGAYLQSRIFISQLHQLGKITGKLGCFCFHLSFINLTGATVQGNEISLFQYHTVHFNRTGFIVDVQCSGTGHTTLTHATSHNSSVRCHAATCGQDTIGNSHTCQIFRRSFYTHHHHALTAGMPFGSIFGKEHNLSASCTRRSRKAASQNLGLLQSRLVKHRVKQFIQLIGFATQQSRLFVNHTLMQQVGGNLHHSRAGTLAVTCLEEPEFTFLYGELHVLHISIMVFQLGLQSIQFLIYFGHCLFHRRIFGRTFFFTHTGKFGPTLRTDNSDLLRSTDTGHNVFTLRVNQIFAVEEVFARSSIAAKANSRSGSVSHIAEHHCLNAYSRTPFIRNSLHFTIQDSAFVHPRVEYGADSSPQLFVGTGREVFSGLFLYGSLESLYKLLEVFHFQFIIQLHAFSMLHIFYNGFKRIDIFFVDRLHTQYYIAVHLHETTV